MSTLTPTAATTIRVNIPHNPYEVRIDSGGSDGLGALLRGDGDGQPGQSLIKPQQKVLVVSNPVVFELYGARAIASLTEAGYTVCHCI